MSPSPVDSPAPSLSEIYARQAQAARQKSIQHWESRIAVAQAALTQDPLQPEAYIDLSRSLAKLRKYDDAVAVLDVALGQCPSSERLHEMRVSLLEECNQTPQAIAAAQEALRRFPENAWFRLKEALLLPVLYSGEEEIAEYRRRFTRGLAKVVSEITLDSPAARTQALSAISSHVNLALGYQARDDRALQVAYGEFVHRVMAASYPELAGPVPMPPLSPDGRLRVGYVSGRFRDVSATKIFSGWLARHAPSKFEVFAYHLGAKTDAATAEVKRSAGHFRHLTAPVEEISRTIRADQLHILVFLDIGLKPLLTQLGALRLAPIQCLAWDQPITSGLPTMDYFISSALMEPPGGDDHYSERLIRLPGVGVCFQQPVIPRMLLARERRDFNLKEDAVVYLCCQASYKYLPQYDALLPQIAKRVPNSQFAFLAINSFVARDLRKRLDRAFSLAGLNARDYCVLLEEMDRFTYWNLHSVADIFLDTIGWSGGVSTIEAIACRLPVVTLPGNLMRSNHSTAILTRLGVTETIARDQAGYVQIASRLGLDRPWREQVKRSMEEGAAAFYSDDRCVSALEDFFLRAARSAAPAGVVGKSDFQAQERVVSGADVG
jgi:predicted O-linked N-acetylglucosamine transferase (SPINDLY family)